MDPRFLPELRSLPPWKEELSGTPPSMAATLLIPARNCADSLPNTVRDAHAYLSELLGEDFEIVLIPNPRPGNKKDRTTEAAQTLSERYRGVRFIEHQFPQGKGAALRTGFSIARGRIILFTDADLPYDLEFFARAMAKLAEGYELVTGNRRLPTSEFDVPVGFLSLAYKRHRLGLLFNLAVRILFPVRTTDTQAGIKAMSRKLASRAFSLQTCPGFFFDLEIFMTALENSHRFTELPVTLYLNSEKSTVRLMREAVLAVFWLVRLSVRTRLGRYVHE